MKRLITTLTAAAAATAALALGTPAFAQYSGQAPAGTQNGLPAASSPAPSPSPVLALGSIGAGLLLVGAGGATLTRRRAVSR